MEISTGCFTVNDCMMAMANSDLPFGGVGASGYGRYHGREGMHACSNRKSILLKDEKKNYPYDTVFPPFTEDKKKMIAFASKWLDLSQADAARKVVKFWIIVFILWLVVSGRAKKILKGMQLAFKMLKMMS